jgi:DMSO/TMAO reductase YedYZ molybdopterin-dependent catalytic subunit
MPVTMECAGNGRAWMSPRSISQPWLGEAMGTSEWTGTPLRPLLEEAGLDPTAVEVVFTGADRGVQGEINQLYQRALTIDEATRDEVLLAYEMNGQPLEPQHGAPLRLLVPGWYGMTSVKWLTTIEAIDQPFDGYQQQCAYRYTDNAEDFGEPASTIRPRAMMSPPGIPDFLTRTRVVQAGKVTLAGRAWAGRSEIAAVEVSTDGGQTWEPARLDPPVGRYAWCGWSSEWDARPGTYELAVRATSADGNVQPAEAWNHQGVGNNAYHRVDVIVEEPD